MPQGVSQTAGTTSAQRPSEPQPDFGYLGDFLRQPRSDRTVGVPASVALTCGIAAIVAVLDFATPAELDVALFYTAALLTSAWVRSFPFLWSATLAVVIATYAGAFFGAAPPPGVPISDIWINRTLTAFALVSVAAILHAGIRRMLAVEVRDHVVRQLAQALDFSQALIRRIDGTVLFWSRGAELLYGWTRSEAVGKMSHSLLKTEFPTPLHEIEHAVALTHEWTGELRHVRKDGTPLWVASHWTVHTSGTDRLF